MRFEAIGLDGAWLVHPERIEDSRGHFVRTFCVNEFREHGLATEFPQHSVSSSSNKGTVRGMHFQRDPHGEVKLVRCLNGSIWDVIIDIRPGSPTFRQSRGFELSKRRKPSHLIGAIVSKYSINAAKTHHSAVVMFPPEPIGTFIIMFRVKALKPDRF